MDRMGRELHDKTKDVLLDQFYVGLRSRLCVGYRAENGGHRSRVHRPGEIHDNWVALYGHANTRVHCTQMQLPTIYGHHANAERDVSNETIIVPLMNAENCEK